MKTLLIICLVIIFLNVIGGIRNAIKDPESIRDLLGWATAFIWCLAYFCTQY